jgi:type II secretory pathway pseudopilin PulG
MFRLRGASWRSKAAQGGFALRELLATLAVVVVLGAVALPMLGRNRCGSRQLRDSTQVRGIHQSMVTWRVGNNDDYPVPDKIDKAGKTVNDDSLGSKDTPRHILSLLIFNGFITPDFAVSPAESDTDHLVAITNFHFDQPPAAADASLALWDPAFRASPIDDAIGPGQTDHDPGNESYAFSPVAGKRKARWLNTFNSTEPVIGDRGPMYDWSKDHWRLTAGSPFGDRSHTLLIHGGPRTWEGNIAYNDNHVAFETRPDPPTVTFKFGSVTNSSAPELADNMFANEDDNTRFPIASSGTPDSRGRLMDPAIGANANAYLKVISWLSKDGTTARLWQD